MKSYIVTAVGILITLGLTSVVKGQVVEMPRLRPGETRVTWVDEPKPLRNWITGAGEPLGIKPELALPVYVEVPPPRDYFVLGYVRINDRPPGPNTRWKALQLAAIAGKERKGDALYLVLPRRGEFMMAAVLKWNTVSLELLKPPRGK